MHSSHLVTFLGVRIVSLDLRFIMETSSFLEPLKVWNWNPFSATPSMMCVSVWSLLVDC